MGACAQIAVFTYAVMRLIARVNSQFKTTSAARISPEIHAGK